MSSGLNERLLSVLIPFPLLSELTETLGVTSVRPVDRRRLGDKHVVMVLGGDVVVGTNKGMMASF